MTPACTACLYCLLVCLPVRPSFAHWAGRRWRSLARAFVGVVYTVRVVHKCRPCTLQVGADGPSSATGSPQKEVHDVTSRHA